MNTHRSPWMIAGTAAMLLVMLACNLPIAIQPTAEPPAGDTPVPGEIPTPEGEGVEVDPGSIYPPPFAEYPAPSVRLPSAFPASYSLPLDLTTVRGVEELRGETLTDAQLSALAQFGFVVQPPVPGQIREFYQIYERSRYGDAVTNFVTTDSVFHIYHLIFDKMLRDLETESFIPALETLTSKLLAGSYAQYQSLRGTALEEPALRNVAYFGVAARLLGLSDPIPAEAASLVDAELAFINAASMPGISPIWDREDLADDKKLIEDYSQYIPRGHYTRSDELKKYFKTMMWYGRLTFRLRDDFETRRALLLSTLIRNDAEALQLWQGIYDPTVFIVGKADDLSFYEYGGIMDAVFGANPDPALFADEDLFAQFKATAATLPPPQVNSMWVWIWEDRDEATTGFRLMGQRFTLDAYVFGQVMWRKVGTEDKPRDLPKPLDFFAAMGSQEARDILIEMGEPDYENYLTQLDKVTAEVAALETDSWTQNLYWSWLYAFQPLIEPKDGRYPPFMQNQAWTRKQLQTAHGSYTELKHDTILYAKQVMAEMGGGGEEEPPKGYVEPNPEAFARLNALAQMTRSGLQERNLLVGSTPANLDNLIDLLTFLQSCAEKELNGEALSTDDYWRIAFIGGELEALTLAAADTVDPMDRDLSDQKAALVADIATGIGRVLEVAIGQPTHMYVVLPDAPYRMAVGAVYTYYEFEMPPDQRMTDETWQGKVESGDTPPMPEWTGMFIVP